MNWNKNIDLHLSVMEDIPIFIVIISADGTVHKMNEVLLRALDYSIEEVTGKDYLTTFVPPEEREELAGLFKAIIGSHESTVNDNHIIARDGSRLLVEWRGKPLLNPDKSLDFFYGLGIDVTAYRRAEAKLQISENKYRAVFEGSHDAITIMNENGAFLDCNKRALDLFGLQDKDEFYISRPADFSPALQRDGRNSREASRAYIARALEKGEHVLFEWLFQRKNGEPFPAEVVLTAYLLGGETIVQSTIRDITDRKRAEADLKKSEEQFRYISEFAPLALAIVDEVGNYEYINPRYMEDFGYTLDDIPNRKQWFQLAYPDPFYRQKVIDAWDGDLDRLGRNIIRPRVFKVTCKDGSVKDIHFRPVLMDNGKQLMISEDVTVQKKAEEALRQSEHRFRQIAEFSPLPLSISDTAGRNEYFNPEFEELFGYTLVDIPTRERWFELAYPDPDYRRHVMDTWLSDLHEKADHVCIPRQFRVVCKGGDTKEILFRFVGMENGRRLIIYEDITDRLKAEKDIRDRNKELTTLYTLSTQLRAATNSANLLPIMLSEVMQLLEADDGMVILLTPERTSLTISAAAGHWADSRGKSLPLKEGCLSIVIAGGNPYVTSDYSRDKNAIPLDHGTLTGPAVFVPLQSQETILGILVLARRRGLGAKPFFPTELHLLNAVGEMAGNALQRQQLHEKAQEQMERLQALRKIDMAITGNLDLYSTLQLTLFQVTEMLHVDGAAILRLNPDKTMQYAAWRGFWNTSPGQISLHPGTSGVDKTIQHWTWEHAIAKRRPFFIPDLSKISSGSESNTLMEREGFAAYGALPLVARDEVQGVLEVFHRKPLQPGDDWHKFLETLADQAAIAIENDYLFSNLERVNVELALAYDATIEGWAHALDLRDEETEGHSQRVMEMTVTLGMAMGVPDDQLLHIRRGALLHDIGKMGIPDAILLKPGKLTEEEWEIMRRHPQYAREMLSPIEYLRPALQIPFCHHEKWDGSGYPQGLGGVAIPLEARIFAVVDVYDALTSDRPYRSAWTREQTLEFICGERGRHFDPRVVDLFLEKLFV